MSKGGIPFSRGESEAEGKAWGHGSYANMPQDVHMELADGKVYHMDEKLDDTMRRLGEDSRQAGVGKRKNLDRGMY